MLDTLQGIGMTSLRTRERLVKRLEKQGIHNPKVLELFRSTPRHIFVDEALASRSYEDTALPIGYSQTISQPYIVARMTEVLLETGPIDKVLEVGTGSGYQAAILSPLVETIYTVERILPLLNQARRRFQLMKLTNIRVNHADGNWGWQDHAPFDAIIATAAPQDIPQSLLDQLALGGRLIAPVGDKQKQQLTLVTRTTAGFAQEILDDVSFVPMLSGCE